MKRAMIIASLGLGFPSLFRCQRGCPASERRTSPKSAIHGHHLRIPVGSAPMDMRQELAAKAEKEGASSYRIIEARTGDSWHATAELYK